MTTDDECGTMRLFAVAPHSISQGGIIAAGFVAARVAALLVLDLFLAR